MTPDLTFDTLALGVLAFLLTYLMHSTLLLGGVFSASRLGWLRSAATEDTLWKVALVGGLVTASVVSATGFTPWGGRLTLGDDELTAAVSQQAPTDSEGFLVALPSTTSMGSGVAPAVLVRTAPRPRPVSQRERLANRREPLSPSSLTSRGAAVTRSLQGETLAAHGLGPSVAHTTELHLPGLPRTSRSAAAGTTHSAGTAAVQPGEGGAWTWIGLAFAAWLLFMLGGLTRSLLLRRQLNKVLAGRRAVVDQALVECLDRLAERAGLSGQVRLSTSAFLSSPVALGSREICLPPQALTELSPEGQEAMLAHELAHLVRHDPAWLALCQVIEATFFFQPLNRLGRKRLQATAEFLCDDWAVAITGRRREFAQCLAQVASWMARGPVRPLLPAAVPAMARSESALVQRVQRLARGAGAGAVHRGQLTALSLVVLGAVSCGVPTIAPSGDESLVNQVVGAVSQALKGLSLTGGEAGNPAAAALVPEPRASAPQQTAADEVEEQDTVEVFSQGDIAVEISPSGMTALTLNGVVLQVLYQGERLLLVNDDLDLKLSAHRFDLSPVDGELTLSLEIFAEDIGQAQALGLSLAAHGHDHQGAEREARREAELRAVLGEYERALASFEREQRRAEELFEQELAQAERQSQREQGDRMQAMERELRAVNGEFEKQARQQERQAEAQLKALEREFRQAARAMDDESEEWEEWVAQWEQHRLEIESELEHLASEFDAEFEAQIEALEWALMSEAEAWETEWERGSEEAEWVFEQSLEAAEREYEILVEQLDREIEELDARDCDHGCEVECAFGCTHPDDDSEWEALQDMDDWDDDCDLDWDDDCDLDCDVDEECEVACEPADCEEPCEAEQACEEEAADVEEVHEVDDKSDDIVFGSRLPVASRAAA